ncbi:hypothetical protein [Myceligenerans indicum]|uniref:Uncharacterized protein n=1 Tax=Myceligenerans indicum TaxID=2593663 RepID=A0ABS1LQ05_9MICO|nr:hypothetical protein [Myceligenerans indicum]MBL0888084.1 hypothetical protein [Myceligenerans indicum]
MSYDGKPVNFHGRYLIDHTKIHAGTNAPLAGPGEELIIIFPAVVGGVSKLLIQAGGNPDSSDVVAFKRDGQVKPTELANGCAAT